jgi:hypothetical protein
MSAQVPAQKENLATPSQPTQQSSPLFEQPPFIEARSETVGNNSNISKELEGIQSTTIRRSLNWQNITVKAPPRSDENSLLSDIQPQQEQPAPAIERQLLAKEQKNQEEASTPVISTDEGSPQPKIDRDNLDGQNTEEAEIQMKSGVQRASDGNTQGSSSIESHLANSKGRGSALSDDARSFMERYFDADFGDLKVHTNSETVHMNKELGTQAFTNGSNIYYGAGKSPGKNELTVHELTHTIQKGAAMQMNKEGQRQLYKEEKQKNPQAKKIYLSEGKKSLQKNFFNKESSFKTSGTQDKSLAAKELPSHNTVLSHNKKLLQKTLYADQQEMQEQPIQAKQFTNSC